MVKLFFSFGILAAASIALGQLTPDEIQHRLDELNRKASQVSVGADTRPTTRPAIAKKRAIHWRAKEGAPAAVKDFINSLPQLKAQFIASRKAHVADLKQQRDQIGRQQVRWIRTGRTSSETDTGQIAAIHNQVMGLTEQIEAEWKEIRKAENDPLWLPPQSSLDQMSVGAFGTLPALHVIQIVGDHELIATHNSDSFWLTGMDTSKAVDDQDYSYSGMVIVAGTKRYQTILGWRTVYLVKPFDLMDNIEQSDE